MKNDKNYLDFIPVKNSEYKWTIDDNNKVIVEVIHKGFFNKIAQIFFKRPESSFITLDELGSFVWTSIDSNNNIGDIALKIKNEFGEDNRLYERLIKFCKILKENKFITYK